MPDCSESIDFFQRWLCQVFTADPKKKIPANRNKPLWVLILYLISGDENCVTTSDRTRKAVDNSIGTIAFSHQKEDVSNPIRNGMK